MLFIRPAFAGKELDLTVILPKIGIEQQPEDWHKGDHQDPGDRFRRRTIVKNDDQEGGKKGQEVSGQDN